MQFPNLQQRCILFCSTLIDGVVASVRGTNSGANTTALLVSRSIVVNS